ncbi:MAG: prepilin peptidase [Patescibacteria group bacterium]|nr:prepilin peptidase [Patescibacteria group bacterium]
MDLFFIFFIFFLGLLVGSFLNCLVWRLYKEEGMWNRSYCPACRQPIAWHDNIPILSFILLGGKCRHCHGKISWQYPIVELVAGVLFVLSFYLNFKTFASALLPNFQFFPDLASEAGRAIFNLAYRQAGFQLLFTFNFLLLILKDWFIIAVMIVIFIYDLRWYLILDKVTLPACLAVFIFNLALGVNWLSLVITGAIGASFFLIQFLVSRGRWIGGGDIRLGLLMGLALGQASHLILAILLAYFAGSVIGLGLIAFKKKKWKSEIPLGVFLSSATIFTLFFGDRIVNWYLGLF